MDDTESLRGASILRVRFENEAIDILFWDVEVVLLLLWLLLLVLLYKTRSVDGIWKLSFLRNTSPMREQVHCVHPQVSDWDTIDAIFETINFLSTYEIYAVLI